MYNRDFLRELDLQKNKTIYARISALQFNESPIESIEGKVTQGSINLDGASALRRTCSLSMVADEININNYYWGLNTKFKLEIGVENTINKNYEDIIWFQQGIFVITSFSTALSTGGYTINISGKDKMCLLNGEVGGTINSSVDFGQIDEIDEDGNVKTVSYPIKDIIRDSVHQYAGEPLWNIIINDVEDSGLELLEYRYDIPMYLLREVNNDTYFNATFDGDMVCWLRDGTKTSLNKLQHYDALVSSLTELVESTEFRFDDSQKWCQAAKVEYGQTAGYRTTPLTYPGELVANVGSSLTSILDKIVNMLGNFEYFYDLDGRFVFQKKKTYINTTFSPIVGSEDEGFYVEGLAYTTGTSYNFSGSELITAFNNAPNLNNLRNDYSVWGVRKSVTGNELPVHMRYAIDEKPTIYTNYDGITYTTLELEDLLDIPNASAGLPLCLQEFNAQQIAQYGSNAPQWWDIHAWAEYYKSLTGTYPTGIMGTYGNTTCKMNLNEYFLPGTIWNPNKPLFLFEVNADGTLGNTGHNPQNDNMKPIQSCTAHLYSYFLDRAKNGVRSFIFDPTIPANTTMLYEKTDWRELIYQMALDYRKHNHDDDFALRIVQNHRGYDLYLTGLTGYEQYYIDMEGFWRDLYYPKFAYDADLQRLQDKLNTVKTELNKNPDSFRKESLTLRKQNYETSIESLQSKYENYYNSEHAHAFWNKNIYEQPETLNFWFDFLDSGSELGQFSCKMVGCRPKAVNDKDVKSIYFRDTPTIIFTKDISKEEIKPGYRYFTTTANYDTMFSISAQGKSAKDEIDTLLYNHSYCVESTTITAIPIYYLEPNTRIYVFDQKTGIEGDYIVSKITLPLAFNGTMSITATKAPESLL